jgi:hypothetical protein
MKTLPSCWYDEPASEKDFEGLPLLYLHMLFDGLEARIIAALDEEQREDYWPFSWWHSADRLVDEFGWRVYHLWLENFALLFRVVADAEARELRLVLEEAA